MEQAGPEVRPVMEKIPVVGLQSRKFSTNFEMETEMLIRHTRQ